MEKNEMVLFEFEDNRITLPVKLQGDNDWLTQNQMAHLSTVANLRQFSCKGTGKLNEMLNTII